MKKMFILASIALVGAACSKSDDNGGNNQVVNRINNSTVSGNPFATEETTVYPTEKRGTDQNYSQTTYTVENNKVKAVVTEIYRNGQKIDGRTISTNITYNEKGLPSKLEDVQGRETRKLEYTYNDKNQVKEITLTEGTDTEKQVHEYDVQGRLSKITFTATEDEPYTVTYEYPDENTVVEKDSRNENEKITYTIEGGNLTKKVKEITNPQGQVVRSETKTYKYDTSIKNPDASLERKLISFDYFEEARYTPSNSKNAVTEIATTGNDNGHPLTSSTTTYTYEKNDKGYPTKKTKTIAGSSSSEVTTYTY